MKKSIEVISLIYKSTDYLKFVIEQMKTNCISNEYDVHYRIVANDATEEILEALKKIDIPYSIFTNKNQDEYYINRVYRAYNYAYENSKFDNIVLLNSDGIYDPEWLDNCLIHFIDNQMPSPRAIENPRVMPAKNGLSKDFGNHPTNLKYDEFYSFANKIKSNFVAPGGIYMPIIFKKDWWLKAGKLPEGNIYKDGIGKINQSNPFLGLIDPGDAWFFREVLNKQFGIRHVTVYNSIMYHIAEGEKNA